jgi:predicted glutamine amidotransferase
MCRLVGWVARTPMTLAQVLGEPAVARFIHLSNVHADGWGACWHDDEGTLRATRSDEPARTDDRFTELAEGMASRSAVVHLRLGTPGCGHGPRNSHPFVDGPWAMAHNGAISPGDRVDLLLPAGRTPAGDTDTERYFLAVRAELDRNAGSVPAAMEHVTARMVDVGLSASSLNAMLLGPDALHVISSHDADWQATTIQVWPADELASGVALPAYFPMLHRVTEDAVVTASSGIVSDPDSWTPVPNHAVFSIDLVTHEATTAYLRGHGVSRSA